VAVRAAPARADARASARRPGTDRTADTAITDEFSKTIGSAARILSELRPDIVDRVARGKAAGVRRRASSGIAAHSSLSPATSRRRVDRGRQPRRGSLEPVQPSDRRRERAFLFQQACAFESGRRFPESDAGHAQTSASAARIQTGDARKATMPSTSTAVAGGPSDEEVVGARRRPLNTLDAADLLDQEAERRIHEVLIELTVTDASAARSLRLHARHRHRVPMWIGTRVPEGQQIALTVIPVGAAAATPQTQSAAARSRERRKDPTPHATLPRPCARDAPRRSTQTPRPSS